MCNFFADPGIFHSKSKIVVRQYATLYFVIVIDQNESELAILDLIQVFFENKYISYVIMILFF